MWGSKELVQGAQVDCDQSRIEKGIGPKIIVDKFYEYGDENVEKDKESHGEGQNDGFKRM